MVSGLQSVKFRVMFVRKVAATRDWCKLSQRNQSCTEVPISVAL